ncbi:MAG: class I SAM-dependent methyltransferase [Candidatus Limnocylindria bacterium]
MTGSNLTSERHTGGRFAFGANWQAFLRSLTEERIVEAERSLQQMLDCDSLRAKRFLDIGSGSGLSSLAARRLGATVHSFDFDLQSVACTAELRQRYFPNDAGWRVDHGSVLDVGYLATLGHFDVVYSWGVLHHTGAMWQAMDNLPMLLPADGTVFVALYNDQGWPSRVWWWVKRLYGATPRWLRWVILGPVAIRIWGPRMIYDCLRLRPFQTWRSYAKHRGMSPWHDLVDWSGGFPFEVCRPEAVLAWGRRHGLVLERMTTCGGGLGCNQFVLRRASHGS